MATRTGRAPWTDPGEVRSGYGPAAVTTGRPARQRLLAAALGQPAGAVASAGGSLGPLAAGRWSVGAAGPGDGVRSRWVCSVRLCAGTAEARPGHVARPGRMRPARQRVLAAALGVSASAGGPLGLLAAGRWSVGSAGPGGGVRLRWVCSVRLCAGTAEARPGRMRPGRQRVLAAALGVSASAGGPLGLLAAGRWSVGSAGPGDGVRSWWVCSVRLRAGTAEARPGHVAWPLGRPHRTPVTVRAGTAVVPDAGRAWPSPGRYAGPAAAPGPALGRLARYEDADGDEPLIAEGAVRPGTATSPTTTGSGVRPPRTPAPPGTRPNLSFAGPPDARRPGGHRCP
ncbi:hypothetical protein TPA0910_00460 [Streptomyces hygroscopicus subsp. sporocinereus]|uniref:Uncharacterized protein n=1 Tax=Streptomyces hygroscopicus TaxID=1912 RepID=A0ABQ3TRL0_STRHY|nr:hypothetical protein TPA0910_00460 [Streptomyces hygroscopicus]